MKNRGFTLIELLVVIAIISILSSIIIASLGTSRMKARDAAIQEELVSLRSAAELYYSNNNESYNPLDAAYGGSGALASCSGALTNPNSMFNVDSQIHAIIAAILTKDGDAGTSRCAAYVRQYGVAIVAANQTGVVSPNIRYWCLDNSELKIEQIETNVNPLVKFEDLSNGENSTVRCL